MEINFTMLGEPAGAAASYAERARFWGPQELCDDIRAALNSKGMTNVLESDYENMLIITMPSFVWELYVTLDRLDAPKPRVALTAVSDMWCESRGSVAEVSEELARVAFVLSLARPVTVVTAAVPRW